MKTRVIVSIFLYMYGVFIRYSIGTFHCRRFQTFFKKYRFPKPLQIVLFMSYSNMPVSYHAVIAQITDTILIILLALNTFEYLVILKIFLYIQSTYFIFLALETIIFYFLFEIKKCISDDNRIIMDFGKDTYSIIQNGQQLEGYLDLSFPNNYIFFGKEKWTKNEIIDYGKFKVFFSGKTKEFRFESEKLKSSSTEDDSVY